jgi:hypothetical protein
MGNVCAPQDLTFTFAGGCGLSDVKGQLKASAVAPFKNAYGSNTFNKVAYTITGALMTNLGVTVGSQDMLVNENITLMFANLDCADIK